MAQESSGEEGNREKDEKILAKKEVQVVTEEELEEVDLGFGSQGPRPISISTNLTEKEKSGLYYC